MQNDRLKNYLHLHFIVFIWGFTAVLGALISLDADALVWYRMSIAVVFMMGYVLYKKESFYVPRKTLLLLLLGGMIIAGHWLAFFSAIKVSNVSITLATLSTGAFFTSILEPIFYKRKVVYYEILLGLLVVLGLWMIFSVDTSNAYGILLALIATLLSSAFSLLNGKLVHKHKASIISTYEIGFGVLCLSIYIALTRGFDASFFQLSNSDWVYIFILATACTAYAFIASVHVMRWISPYTVMLTINMEPIYGIILALLILGDQETMSSGFYYGAVIIIVSVLLNGVLKNRSDRKGKEELAQ